MVQKLETSYKFMQLFLAAYAKLFPRQTFPLYGMYCVYIVGVNNVITDCLSCFQQDKFRQLTLLANAV